MIKIEISAHSLGPDIDSPEGRKKFLGLESPTRKEAASQTQDPEEEDAEERDGGFLLIQCRLPNKISLATSPQKLPLHHPLATKGSRNMKTRPQKCYRVYQRLQTLMHKKMGVVWMGPLLPQWKVMEHFMRPFASTVTINSLLSMSSLSSVFNFENHASTLGLDKICFFFYLFCFAFMLDKSTYFAFPIHPFCFLFHPFCFPKIPF